MKPTYRMMLLAGMLIGQGASSSWGAGLWLYEMGQPDMGTAAAGRAAIARDASTAFSNPAGMTRLDRSQLMAAALGLYVDAAPEPELEVLIHSTRPLQAALSCLQAL